VIKDPKKLERCVKNEEDLGNISMTCNGRRIENSVGEVVKMKYV